MPVVPVAATGPRLAGQSNKPPYKAPTVSVRSPPNRNAAPRLARGDSDNLSTVSHTSSTACSSLGASDPYKRPPSAASSHGGGSVVGSVVSHSSVRTDGPAHSHGQHPVRKANKDSAPKFFHASDAKPHTSPTLRQHSKPPVSNPKFFYAASATAKTPVQTPAKAPSPRVLNAHAKVPSSKQKPKLDPTPITAPQYPKLAPSMVSPVSPVRDRNSKFVYANGTEENFGANNGSSRSVSPHQTSSSTLSSTMSSNMSCSPPRAASNHPAQSPKVHYSHQPQPTVKSPVLPSAPPQLSCQNSVRSRRPSIDMSAATPPRRHSRAVSIGSYAEIKPHLPPDVANTHQNGAPHSSHPSEAPLSPKYPPMTFSPKVSAAAAMIEQQKELAAAARRERKVLDLEISNASLLAINKTLEKKMRKQLGELRRFRRLARSGALNALAPKKKSSRELEFELDEFYDANDDEAENKKNASKRSSEDEDEDEEEDEEEDEDEEGDSADASTPKEESGDPTTAIPQDHIIARRVKDEKRLASDIAKHQALLDASAKMNASLKRCQFVAEALIEEGKKALSYVVRPSEVKLGGRVLNHADDDSTFETETEDGHGLDDDEDGYSTPTYQESEATHDSDGHSIYSQSDATSNSEDDRMSKSDSEEPTNLAN